MSTGRLVMENKCAVLDRGVNESINSYDKRISELDIMHIGYAYFSTAVYDVKRHVLGFYSVWNEVINSKFAEPLQSYGYVLSCSQLEAGDFFLSDKAVPIYCRFASIRGRLLPRYLYIKHEGRNLVVSYIGLSVSKPINLCFKGMQLPINLTDSNGIITSSFINAEAYSIPSSFNASSYIGGSFIVGSFIASSFSESSFNIGSYNVTSFNGLFNINSFYENSYTVSSFNLGSFYYEFFNNSSFETGSFNIGSYLLNESYLGSFFNYSFLSGSFNLAIVNNSSYNLNSSFNIKSFIDGSYNDLLPDNIITPFMKKTLGGEYGSQVMEAIKEEAVNKLYLEVFGIGSAGYGLNLI